MERSLKPLAIINTKPIYDSDIDAVIAGMGERGEAYQSPQGRAAILEQLIAQKLFLADAMRNLYEREPAFKEELARIKEQLLTQYAISKAVDSVTVTDIEAGKPYLVKWTGSSNIANPVFNNVVVNKAINDVKYTSGGKTVTFKGTYDRLGFAEENRSILFVGTGNKLFWPLAGASIGAMRSYFELDGFSSETNDIKQFIKDRSAPDLKHN
jgi:hypothetical protein